MRSLANAVSFQLGWLACVLSAAAGRPWLGVGAVAVLVAMHLVFVARDARREARLIAAVTAFGFCVTTTNTLLGAVAFPVDSPALFVVPVWILALWAIFATTLRHSLGWLTGRHVLGAAFGLVGSPLSYMAAERLGATALHPAFARGPLVLGITWAIAVPVSAALARRLGRGPDEAAPGHIAVTP